MARKTVTSRAAKSYKHADKDAPMRPDVGTQPRFTKKQPPKTYRYDSSLSPAPDYHGQKHARELGEWLLRQIEEASVLPSPHKFKEMGVLGYPNRGDHRIPLCCRVMRSEIHWATLHRFQSLEAYRRGKTTCKDFVW